MTDHGLVVCNFIGRFVFVANMEINQGYCRLTKVRNIRYWADRENGLGELAEMGPIDGDIIDPWSDTLIPLDKLGPFMQANMDVWDS